MRNKERLVPVREGNVGTKRRKLNSEQYTTIEENWGPPTMTLPEKKTREQEDNAVEQPAKRTRIKEPTILTNLRTVENKIITVKETNKDLEWEDPRDWNKVLTEHRERIQREETEKNQRLERQRKKKESWALYTLCKNFLEENSTLWKILKDKQMENRERNNENQRSQNEK